MDAEARREQRRPDREAVRILLARMRQGLDMITEAELVRVARRLDPRSRGDDLFRYTRNGSTVRERSCRLCGYSTSWCGRWPRTKESLEAEADHVRDHLYAATMSGLPVEDYVAQEVARG